MKTYTYDNIEYKSESQLRKAIWFKERKALPKLSTVEDWAKYGVEVEDAKVEPSLDELKARKNRELDDKFGNYRNASSTYMVSSLGYKVNANVVAFDNVNGLVAQLEYRKSEGEENPTVGFMTFEDELVELDLASMRKLLVEISQNGSKVYAKKWQYREQIRVAETKEDLEAIVIRFDEE